ncbi:MAG: DUF447 family protein [Thermoplasmata archaeon]|nr:DUF447 family protein [Thermoplasmata archaeon]
MTQSFSLDDLNIHPNITYETIVTTLSPTGRPNSAAIGIQRIANDRLQLKIFEGSNTYDNLKNTEAKFGINILNIDQFDLAIKAALTGWGGLEPEFVLEDYEYQSKTPFLKVAKCRVVCDAESYSVNKVTDDYGTTQIMEIIANINNIIIKDKIETPLTRSEALPLLEAAVWATRFKCSKGVVKIELKNKIDKYIKLAIEQGYIANSRELIDLIKQFIGQNNSI